MKILLTSITLLWLSNISFSQTIQSGEYDSVLKLAYDSTTKKLTGYYENYSGLDEATGNPKFSCIFYIQGTITGSLFAVDTYYHADKSIDKKQKSYLIKNDFVCIDKIEDEWAHCTYYGKKITKGWIKTADLNKI